MLHLLAYLALAVLLLLVCMVMGFIFGLDILVGLLRLAIRYWPITLIIILILLII